MTPLELLKEYNDRYDEIDEYCTEIFKRYFKAVKEVMPQTKIPYEFMYFNVNVYESLLCCNDDDDNFYAIPLEYVDMTHQELVEVLKKEHEEEIRRQKEKEAKYREDKINREYEQYLKLKEKYG